MSSTIETSYSRSTLSYSTAKMTRRDQNGNFVRTHRDSSLPPPTRKSKLIPESPVSMQQPVPPPRKHVSISQSDLQGYPYDNRVYINETINNDRQLPLRSSYRPPSRQSHLNPNLNSRANTLNYDENLSYQYASRRAINPMSPRSNSNYHRNINQGQTLPLKKSPYSNYAFHVPPSYYRYGSRSSSAPYDRFGHHALERSYPAQTMQAIPDMVTTAELEQSDYDRKTPRKILLSEGNLLTAHIEKIRDDGRDNPFKPGTELSWEADLIVRLYKKGHPLSEVPILLERIKKQLEESKSTGNIDAMSLKDRFSTPKNELNNNNEAMIVNKSRTISNDLCYISRAPEKLINLDNNNRKQFNITSSETTNNGIKSSIDDDELIERIISNFEGADIKRQSDNSKQEYLENSINKSREVGKKTKLPPAIINIPKKNSKDDMNGNSHDRNPKQSNMEKTTNKKKSDKGAKSKTKKGQTVQVNDSNVKYEIEATDTQDNKTVDVKRHKCCSIQ